MGFLSRLLGDDNESAALSADAQAVVDAFLSEAKSIPWFANVGLPSARDASVARLTDWSAWTGPEHESSLELDQELGESSAALGDPSYPKPVRPHDLSRPERRLARGVWLAVYDPLVSIAGAPLGVLGGALLDPWDAKQKAVMQAAFLGAILCVRTALGRNNAHLAFLWSWYQGGHWPCGYRGKKLLVL